MLKVFGVEQKRKRYITLGIILGIVMSFVFAGVFQRFLWGFEWATEKVYEGILMLVACAMITQFLLWTNSNFKNIWKKIKKSVEHIVSTGQLWMLSILAFASVVREGVETVIFFHALDFSLASNDIWFAIAGVLGAVVISYLLFFTIQKINISKVLRYTNILFIIVAGGLLAHWIVEFQWAWVLPTIVKPFFDLSWILSEKEGIGAILKAAFSYDANPSLLAFVAYVVYIWSLSYYIFFRKKAE